ncbi:MAG: hypothetical protein KDK90_05735 [Leptospiraceae bacterium]|nr:hypothetical protein [Leptospiraceae bacterium]
MQIQQAIKILKKPILWYIFWMILFVIHLKYLSHYVVDVPMDDEWDGYFYMDGSFSSLFSINYLFAPVGTHLVPWTKISISINRMFWDLDFYLQKIINFFMYGGLIAFVAWVLKTKHLPNKYRFLIITLYLSAVNWWTLHRADTNAYLFYNFFLIASIALLSRTGWKMFFLACICVIFCLFSFASGVTASILIALMYAVHLYFFRPVKGLERLKPIILFIIVILGTYFWISTVPVQADPAPKAYPWNIDWWRHFIYLIGWIFGIYSFNIALNIFCLFLAFAGLLLLTWKYFRDRSFDDWFFLTYSAAVILSLALISVGRANLTSVQAKSERYVIFAMFFLPSLFYGYYSMVRIKIRSYVLIFLSIFTFIGYVEYFDYDAKYKPYGIRMRKGLACLKSDVFRETGVCIDIYPWGLRGQMENAKKNHIHFTKSL